MKEKTIKLDVAQKITIQALEDQRKHFFKLITSTKKDIDRYNQPDNSEVWKKSGLYHLNRLRKKLKKTY